VTPAERTAKSLGIGGWGLGRHACKRILPALDSCPDTSLVGVATRDKSVAQEQADLSKVCEKTLSIARRRYSLPL